jgi:hypothetical protein
MKQNIDRISIQVGLSGYSFKIEAGSDVYSSEWMSADRIFATPEFQRRYDSVEIAVFTPKFTLVPNRFFNPDDLLDHLSAVVSVDDEDPVEYVELPDYDAVLVYSNTVGVTLSKVISETVIREDGGKSRSLPIVCSMLDKVKEMSDYNKIMAAYMDGALYLVIVQGKSLLLCNSFEAPDFTTAQYFMFLAMKRLQLNTEVSTVTFLTELDEEQEMSLYRYFRSVEYM